MKISGEIVILAQRHNVWRALNDPAILAQCIEGCEALEKVNDNEFSGRVTAKVGPVKASFSGIVTLSNVVEDTSYTISGEGKGGVAGFAKGGADVQLADHDGGQATRLTYVAHANVGGKLAQLGSRLIESTAKAQADKFFTSLAQLLAPAADVVVPETVVATPAAATGFPAWAWIALLLGAGTALLYVQLS
jgi:uncharacterized protein